MICPNHSITSGSLSEMPAGCRLRVSQIDGGRCVQSRLCSLGLTPGMNVEVIRSNGGAIVLGVLGSRIMIGRNMAKKVLVKKV